MRRIRNKYVKRQEGFAAYIFNRHLRAAHKCTFYKLPVPATPGMSFIFKGSILPACEVFYIELLTEHKRQRDVLLHISALLLQNFIARNTCRRGKWGVNECASMLPFQLVRNGQFHIQLMLTPLEFYIAVNGYHFARYVHRMPFTWLAYATLRGDITNCSIDCFNVTEYPIRWYVWPAQLTYREHAKKQDILSCQSNMVAPLQLHGNHAQPHQLALPFYGLIANHSKLSAGIALRVEGRLRLMPQKFSIALQRGQAIWPQPTVSLQFEFCFPQQKGKYHAFATLSAYKEQNWVNRSDIKLTNTLEPGRAFVFIIFCTSKCYELHINGQLCHEFKHQMDPAAVDMVNIRGDLRLWYVLLEGTKETLIECQPSRKFLSHRLRSSATQT